MDQNSFSSLNIINSRNFIPTMPNEFLSLHAPSDERSKNFDISWIAVNLLRRRWILMLIYDRHKWILPRVLLLLLLRSPRMRIKILFEKKFLIDRLLPHNNNNKVFINKCKSPSDNDVNIFERFFNTAQVFIQTTLAWATVVK